MKRNILSKRIAIFAVLLLLAGLTFSTFVTLANEDEDEEKNWTGALIVGLATTDEDGTTKTSGLSAGKVAEYYPIDTTAMLAFWGTYNKDLNFAQIISSLADEDNFQINLDAFAGRMFMIDFSVDRMVHRLDNDMMADWSYPFSVDSKDAKEEMKMRATVLNSNIRFKPESIPNSVLFLHMRIVAREGNRQARTMDHCYTCHVSTKTQNMDQRMLAVAAGAEYSAKPFAVDYKHEYRSFEDSSDKMSYTYANNFGNFDLGGNQEFASTPDNTTNRDVIRARFDLNDMASLYGKFSRSETENDNTGYTVEQNRFSGRMNLMPIDWLRIRGRYDWSEYTNTVPNAAERDMNRFLGSLIVKPNKQVRVEGSYLWNKVERSGGNEVDETKTEKLKLKATFRPTREWRIVASHAFVDREDPTGRGLRNSFSSINGVLLTPFGTEEDVTNLSVFYSPKATCNFNAVYYRKAYESEEMNLDSTLQNISLNANMNPTDEITMYANYTYFDNEYEKDVYMGVYAPFVSIHNLPYTGEGNTISFGAWIKLGNLTLAPSYNYTTTESSFDDSAFGTGINVPSTIDATFQRVTMEVGIPVFKNMDINLGYYMEDYEDQAQPQDDGTVHWFYGSLGYKF